jgi:hypothetical protein
MSRFAFISRLAAVPLILALLSAIQLMIHVPATKFLVLPPLAVIVYVLFTDPNGKPARFRSIVVLPCLGAIVGEFCSHFLGLTPAGISVAMLIVLLLQQALQAAMPPALALSLLAMLLHVDGVTYPLGVFLATIAIFVIFMLWRQLSRFALVNRHGA